MFPPKIKHILSGIIPPRFKIYKYFKLLRNPLKKTKKGIASIARNVEKAKISKAMAKRKLRPLVIYAAIVIAILGPVLYIINSRPEESEAGWFDETWRYRQRVAITNSGVAQTDYQVTITFNTSALVSAGKMQSDCDDIRVVAENGAILPHWIEENNPGCNQTTTKIWTKVPSIPTSGANVYVYYGNASANGVADGLKVFPMFDDFSDNDITEWSQQGIRGDATNSMVVTGGVAKGGTGSAWNGFKKTFPTVNLSAFSLDVRYNAVSTASFNHIQPHLMAGNDTADRDGYDFYELEGQSVYFIQRYTNNVVDATIVNNDGIALPGGWNYLSLRRNDSNSMGLYMNDVLQGSGTDSTYTNFGIISFSLYNSNNTIDYFYLRKWATTPPTVAAPSTEEESTGLLGYYRFDEGQGTTIYDSAGSGVTGGFSSAPVWTSDSACITSKCLYFDGSDDYVDTNRDLSWTSSDSFTMSAWVNQKVTGNQVVWGKGTTGSTWEYSMRVATSTPSFTYWNTGGGGEISLTSSNNLTLAKWHFLVVTYDGSTARMYLDGVEVDSDAGGGTFQDRANDLNIGAGYYNSGVAGYFNGYIDDFKVYDYARSASEIKQDYSARGSSSGVAAQFGGDNQGQILSSGLIGHWKMDEASWGSVLDSSGSGNTGTSTNGAAITALGKFGNGGSFDGSNDYVQTDTTSFDSITDNFTVAAWVNSDTFATYSRYIFSKGASCPSATNRTWELVTLNDAATVRFSYSLDGSSQSTVTSTTALSTGTWYHLTASYENGTVKIYINGKLDVTDTTNTGVLSSNTRAPRIGGGYCAAADPNIRYWDGELDDVRFYNRVFSDSEVSELYNFAPDPIAYWQMEQGNAGVDSSSNGNTAPYPDLVQGVSHGYIESNITIIAEQFAGSGNAGEFDITCTGGDSNCYVTDTNGRHETPTINNGIACIDGNTGTGYIMYTATSVFTRFSGHNVGNALNYTCVRYNSGWEYDNNTSWVGFTPVATDTLVAEVDYTANTVTLLDDIPIQSIGKYGGGLGFDGSEDALLVANSSSLTLANFTISAWVNINGASDGDRVLSTYHGSSPSNFYNLNLNASGLPGFSFRDTGGNLVGATGTATLTPGQWYYLTGVREANSTATMYVNGEVVASATDTTVAATIAPNSGVSIGWDTAETAGWGMNGFIDDVKIYNYARTPKQIISDMNAGHPSVGSPVASPFLHYKFDEGYGTTINNDGNASSALNGTITGATWTNAGKFNKTLSYDGSADYVSVASSTAFDFGTGDFTITTWINPNSSGGREPIFDMRVGNTAHSLLHKQTNNTIRYQDRPTAGSTTTIITSVNTVPAATWTHVALSRTSGVWSIYLNGKLDTTSTTALDLDASASPRIGQFQDSDTNEAFDGFIDEFKAYDYGLTAEEIKADYNQSKSAVLGSTGTTSAGVADNSAAREYCIPGDTSTCNAPVGEWMLDEGVSGDAQTIYDTSGNGNNGTTEWGSAGMDCSFNGIQGGACKFDGTDDAITILDNAALDVSSAFTISAWVRPDSVSGTRSILRKDSAYVLYYSSQIDFYNWSDASRLSCATSYTPLGVWTHLSAVWDGSNKIMYVNGVECGRQSSVNFATNANNVGIGSDSAGTAMNFDGAIDQVRLYNYARTPAQIVWEYSKGAPIAHYKMDECEGTTIYNSAPTYDDAAAGSDGTLTIGASGSQTSVGTCATSGAWFNGSTGKIGSSMSFDGTDDLVSLGNTNEYSLPVSVSAWVNIDSLASSAPIFTNDKSTATHSGVWFEVGTGGGLGIAYGDNSGTGPSARRSGATAAGVITTGQWYHVVGVIRGATDMSFYVNGVDYPATYSGTGGGIVYTSNLGRIGQLGASSYFDGLIDDVKLYNYGLTSTQVKTEYTSGAVRFD